MKRYHCFPSAPTVSEKDGTRLFFGLDENSRQMNSYGTFRWFLQKSVDTYGNEIRYFYTQDAGQIYLTEIRYSVISDTVFKSVQFLYDPRPDVFSDYHSRSRIVTAKRLKAIQVLSQGESVRVYRLEYQQASDLSLLAQVVQIGSNGTSTQSGLKFRIWSAS